MLDSFPELRLVRKSVLPPNCLVEWPVMYSNHGGEARVEFGGMDDIRQGETTTEEDRTKTNLFQLGYGRRFILFAFFRTADHLLGNDLKIDQVFF
jgi:hypothetical protein